MLNKFKRGISVFFIFLLVFSLFSFINVQEVSAQQPYCCVRTDDNKYCIESEEPLDNCEVSRTGSCDAPAISECNLGIYSQSPSCTDHLIAFFF